MHTPRPKVLVAMSGGVDSSVAAALLLREGYDVVGCFMRLGSPGESLEGLVADDPHDPHKPHDAGACDASKVRIGHQGCCSIADAADARSVAATLGVGFYVCNFKKDFGRIIDYFATEYAAGRTPNPCVRCNDWLKFGKLHDYARTLGATHIASGHYARIEHRGERVRLLRGVDASKDQSYVLFGAPRERLREMLLPIGGFEKPRVREMAREMGLPVFDKPDSQEICFVPDQDYAAMLERRDPALRREGCILDPDGAVVGAHDGQHRFTIGQRRGVGVALGYPIYVVNKDPAANTVTIGPRELLLARGCAAREVNWLAHDTPHAQWTRCAAKIRYNAQPVGAECRVDAPNDLLEVRFDEPQEAVTPGQAVVCYGVGDESDVVLGGGWIDAATPI